MKRASDIASLNEHRAGVPQITRPVYWDRRLGVHTNVHVLNDYMYQYAYALPNGAAFDEAAIMVPNHSVRNRVIDELREVKWEVFNEAADLVYANPFGTRYTVEYTFLQHPDRAWRLELMMLGRMTKGGEVGFSPLHQALWTPNGMAPAWEDSYELPVPHLSFKAVKPSVCEHMRDQDFILAQACQSTYGVFWYFLAGKTNRQIYIKPRINTRDA